jgi:hypothetical protein
LFGTKKGKATIRVENGRRIGNKLIIFDHDSYAIFDVYEVFSNLLHQPV